MQLRIDTLSDMAVLECEGSIVGMEDALRLRYAVMMSQVPEIILDMTEVTAIEGKGLEMMIFLRRWTVAHDIRLRLYNPSPSVRARLQQADYVSDLDIATLDDVVALVGDYQTTFATAA